jgi:hypothetical protein
VRIVTGIASTTHVDAHHERFAKEALDGAAEQIRSRLIPFLIEHDFNRQIGVLLYGRVEPLEDGEFGLFIVAGIFENEEEKRRYAAGAPNTVWQDYTHHLEGASKEIAPQRARRNDPARPAIARDDPDSIATLLELHLDSTSIWIDGSVYKIKHLIASTGDLSIHVYPKDHAPPHFHVISKQRGIDASFYLETLEPVNPAKSSISPRDVKKIKNFFQLHADKLKKLRDEHARMQGIK